jgi:hypothetical protein
VVVHMMIVMMMMMHTVMHVRPGRSGGHHPRDWGGGPRGGGHRGGTGRSAGHCFLRKGVTRRPIVRAAAATRLLIMGIVPGRPQRSSPKIFP